MEAIFSFIPDAEYIKVSDKIMGLLVQKDFVRYIEENDGISLLVTLEHEVVKNEKKLLYRYLNGPLLSCYMQARRSTGEQIDKTSAMLELKCLFAKGLWTDRKGQTHTIIMSQADFTKKELLQFVTDIIVFLESEFGVEAPDAEKYKLMKLKNEHRK